MAQKDTYNAALKVHLDEKRILKIQSEIESGLGQVHKERHDLELEDGWQAADDLYDGVKPFKEFPWPDAANYHISFASMVVDTLVTKAKRQTMMMPLVKLEPAEEITTKVGLAERENALDYRLRKIAKIESFLTPLYRKTAIQGTGILKVGLCRELENRIRIKTYAGKLGIEEYKWDYRKSTAPGKFLDLQKLKDEEVIHKAEPEEIQTFFGPKPYRVALKDLFLRPSITDIKKNRFIGERLHFNWSEIQYRVMTGFYDASVVKRIRERNKNDYRDLDYTFYECILFTDLEQEGVFRRYIITIEEGTREIVRAIHFPYMHNQIHYIPWYIMPKDDSFYGIKLVERMADENKIMDNLWNSALDLAALRANPPKQVSDMTINLKEVAWGPGAVYPTPRGLDTLKILAVEPFQMDSQRLIQVAQRLGEQGTGISAGMSGKENPLDPRAPASKTAMLLREGNVRVEDYVLELLKSMGPLAEQVEKMDLQYDPDRVTYTKDGKPITVEESMKTKNVLYKAHGSITTINKDLDLRMIMEFLGVAAQYFPEVIQNPMSRRDLVQLIIEACGASVERNKEKLMVAFPGKEDLQRKILTQIQAALENEAPEAVAQIREMMEAKMKQYAEIQKMDMSKSTLGGYKE